MVRIILILFIAIIGLDSNGQTKLRPSFLNYQSDQWVDSVFNSFSLDQKIGQLIVVPAFSQKGSKHQARLLKMVRENKVGGIISMQGGPVRHAKMVNALQKASATPLLVAMDAEYGLSMRLDSCLRYPYGFTLGSVANDSLVFQVGSDIGKQCKRLGIQINFAPDADVNSNPLNPVIGFRSYGDNPNKVYQKAVQYGLGLQSEHVLATLKHFPGHGDAQKDSHLTLPTITHSRAQLDSIELYPFRKAIDQGIGGVMTGFLNVPALDSSGTAASLSKSIVQKILLDEYGFEGLVVTDAMNMEGAVDQDDKIGDCSAEIKALMAGNDLLEFVTNPGSVIEAVKKAISTGELTQESIERKCRKILMLKRWAGLDHFKPIETANLYADLNQSSYRMTLRNVAQNSLTVVQNRGDLLPLRHLDSLTIATVSIGRTGTTTFQRSVDRYAHTAHFSIGKDADDATIKGLILQLKKYNLVIAAVNNLGNFVKSNYRVSTSQQKIVCQITESTRAIVVVLGNPYVLGYLDGLDKAHAVVEAYEESNEAQDLAGQLIFGAFGASGQLPIHVNKSYHSGNGITTPTLNRFKYTLPEELGVDSAFLKKKIDSLVSIGINARAFPGCAVFVAKQGKVVLMEAYGYHTYSKEKALSLDDLFDFASLTKVLAPLPVLMQLKDQGKLDVKEKMSTYWTDWKGSNKKDVVLEDVLSHQARLRSGIPFWLKGSDGKGSFKSDYFSKDSTSHFGLRVSKDLYTINSFPDTVAAMIRKSPLLKQKKFLYSDLGFMLFPRMISSMTHQDFEPYLKANFYAPLGASSLGYRPYFNHDLSELVPTENDKIFRHEQLQGFVHDEGAAMLGGVSGNAGLFGTVNDAAKVMQMYLNYGTYGGDRYLADATVRNWSSRHFEKSNNRRGYGFDKPPLRKRLKNGKLGPQDVLGTDLSFGHTGFTGTYAWADPATGILVLFFSNRVYPTRNNHLINRLNIREQIHQEACRILQSDTRKMLSKR